ncbi:MAG: 3-dehydroquinate synthase [Nitrospirota bacterium]
MKNIVLIGFMGTGKTKVGSRLAKRLKYGFIDTDKIIEDKEGKTISEIFGRYGEEYFRDIEKKMINDISKYKGSVIATGGGVVLNPANIASLKKNGIIVCLKASPDIILSRTKNNKSRPLLNSEDRISEITRLLKSREPYYANADIVIDTSDISIEKAVEKIIDCSMSDKIKHKIETIRVELGNRGYDIEIGENILHGLGERIKDFDLNKRIAVITNPTIKRLYGKVVSDSLKRAGYNVKTIVIPDGERYKDLKWAEYIYDRLISARFERNSSLVALGGGVIGDITGFAASTFLRGINYIQVPTTLIAQVDSSVGGKTGVNHSKGKNLIGAFYQPCLVYIDTGLLKTLDSRELIAGMAEIIKYGVIADEDLFSFLEENIEDILSLEDREGLIDVITRSCKIKADIVHEDELELTGKRTILNYGHTIGHALETIGGYKRYRHGEAIAIGMVYAARLSARLGLCNEDCVKRQELLFQKAGLPTSIPSRFRIDDILKTMRLDKKVTGEMINFVLSTEIGNVIVRSIKEREIREFLKG